MSCCRETGRLSFLIIEMKSRDNRQVASGAKESA
jgi:hypothetical protein